MSEIESADELVGKFWGRSGTYLSAPVVADLCEVIRADRRRVLEMAIMRSCWMCKIALSTFEPNIGWIHNEGVRKHGDEIIHCEARFIRALIEEVCK